MVTTLPKVHVAIAGLDKLVASLDDALTALLVLPRNATAQRLTSYVTWMCGRGPLWGQCGQQKDHARGLFG